MALQSTDLFIVERAGVQYHMTADQIADFVGAVRDYSVGDITTRDSLTELNAGDRVFVSDASTESDVNSGWAIYRVVSTSPNVFEKIQEQESMDLIVSGVSNLSLGTVNPAGITIDNDNGTGVTIPLADASNAGLMPPSMFANSHVPATVGLTTATNPINISGQEFTFGISQLTALP